MAALFIALAALVLLGVGLALAGRLDPGMSGTDRPPAPELPAAPWTAADVRQMSFRVGLRGYRMEDVDAMLAALAAQLAEPAEPDATDPAGAGSDAADPPGADPAVTSGYPQERPTSTSGD